MRRVTLEVDIPDDVSSAALEDDTMSRLDYLIGSRIISDILIMDEDEDDDPRCVCGVFRSEHAMLGCPEGFQTPAQWERELRHIRQQVWEEDEP